MAPWRQVPHNNCTEEATCPFWLSAPLAGFAQGAVPMGLSSRGKETTQGGELPPGALSPEGQQNFLTGALTRHLLTAK